MQSIAETEALIDAARNQVSYYTQAITEEYQTLRAFSEAEGIQYLLGAKGRGLLRVIADMSEHRQQQMDKLEELVLRLGAVVELS